MRLGLAHGFPKQMFVCCPMPTFVPSNNCSPCLAEGILGITPTEETSPSLTVFKIP